MKRLILVAALSIAVSGAHAQSWLHWQAQHAMERQTAKHKAQESGKPPVSIRYRANQRGQR
jgi:Tfp pilus assembly protein PilV